MGGGALPSKFFFFFGKGGCWPCGGYKGHRPVGYWCLSGIHQQRPSILIDSHQLTAKHDQWWQDRAICWAKGGCRNTVSLWLEYCSPYSLFFSLSLTLLHLSVYFCPSFFSICAFLFPTCLAARWVMFRLQQVTCLRLPHTLTHSLNRWSAMVCLADYLVGGQTEPDAHCSSPVNTTNRPLWREWKWLNAHTHTSTLWPTCNCELHTKYLRLMYLARVIYIPGFQFDLQKHQNTSSKQKRLNIKCFT